MILGGVKTAVPLADDDRPVVLWDGWSEAIPINAGERGDGHRFAPPILR
jgi:hypothetical protein